MSYRFYLKKLTTNELGYRKGKLVTGQMFFISKYAAGFFPPLSKEINNEPLSKVPIGYLFRVSYESSINRIIVGLDEIQ